MIILLSILLFSVCCFFIINTKKQAIEIGKSQEQIKKLNKDLLFWQNEANEASDNWAAEFKKNQEVISQKKSSETRLGQVTEHIVPFLDNCKHDPRNMKFLGMPIDYIVFDFDQGEITFLEIKTGNSKESKRQKIIKNIIKSGKIYYETMRINDKGVYTKKAENQA